MALDRVIQSHLFFKGLVGDAGVGWIDAERCGKSDKVVLFLHEDLPKRLANGKLVQFVALLDAAAVVGDGLFFVLEIEAEHVFGLFGRLNGLGRNGGHAAKIVDVVGESEGMSELFCRMDGEFVGDIHVLRALENLGVNNVGDDGLVFA
jgi:hypothetical protein